MLSRHAHAVDSQAQIAAQVFDEDVIRFCVEEGVPIYQGKIDKTLFQAQLEATAPKT